MSSQNAQKPTIFIIHPHDDLFSNPTILFIITKLIRKKEKVILLTKSRSSNIPEEIKDGIFFSELPQVYPVMPRRPLLFFRRTLLPYLKFRWLLQKNAEKKIVCIDPEGLIIASKLWPRQTRQFNYISFEMFFLNEIKSGLYIKHKLKEIAILKSGITSLLIQDKYRLRLFLEEHHSYKIDSVFFMPVAPTSSAILPSYNLPEKLRVSIPQGKQSVIYSGSLYKWSGIPELLKSMRLNWDDDFHLIIHNRFPEHIKSKNIQALTKLAEKLPVSIVHLQMGYPEYLEFLKQFDIGIATYFENTSNSHYDGKNFGEIGYSSGKFNTYMMLGIPAITTHSNSFDDLYESYDFGYIINDFSEMTAALNFIKNNYGAQSSEAKRLYNEIMDPEIYIEKYMAQLCN